MEANGFLLAPAPMEAKPLPYVSYSLPQDPFLPFSSLSSSLLLLYLHFFHFFKVETGPPGTDTLI